MSPIRRGPRTVDEYTEWNAGLLARSRISRRDALKAVTAGAGGILLAQFGLASRAMATGGGTPGSAGLAVSGRHLSFVPTLAASSRRSMAVSAQVVSKTGSLPRDLRAWVDVGSAPGSYGTRVPADIVHLVGQYAIPGGPVGSQFYVKAVMDHLRAGCSYHYRIRLSDGTVTGDASFTTEPQVVGGRTGELAPFTFTAFADVGTNAAPTDPGYAFGADPAVVTAAGGTWPGGVFDNNYYNATDPVAGQAGTDRTPAVTQTNLMGTQRPVFTLLAGDICYADPSGTGLPADDTLALTGSAPPGKNNYNPYVWDVFLRQIESQAASTPWMFATGNHDMEPLYGNTQALGGSDTHGYGGHLARLDLPGNGPRGCPSVYDFTYGNVGVISVDANDLSAEIQTNTGYSAGAQQQYLERTLRSWRSTRTIDFIVLFLHHCAYSTTNQHASDGGVRAVLDPLTSRYQVDLVVQGHNHVFERTDPIRDGRKTRDAPDGATVSPATDGTIYVTVGSGGRPRYQFRPAPSAAAPPPPGVTPSGPQALAEGQRYRGYRPLGGPNTLENNTGTVVNSYVWSTDGTTTTGGFGAGTKVPEQIDWSQVRYDDYAFLAVDVVPARRGGTTTMTLRTLADALPGSGTPFTEIDRVTLTRVAGQGLTEHPGAAPSSLLLPHGDEPVGSLLPA
ncbi:twin-arginine translocation signal domain-containing protein [Modestobacter sp. I12A-02628]|uniref:Metallophosphoesterase family protein n=1 Tax=Goekera deserti TaxID=2497753 RepID=A0A7K3WCV0_9ACTN|nr:metallophosphoesterase family protein [Goekera deserti]MPQ96956.1 twin-arginine translocation signal domain-containing protein [Goekera deserti]NDI46729.1 twin-arginine translocation signal domain-containing protein [Goekera deserti]NEL54298.1 metallophosphoesterase family protein [Goekera deserti]